MKIHREFGMLLSMALLGAGSFVAVAGCLGRIDEPTMANTSSEPDRTETPPSNVPDSKAAERTAAAQARPPLFDKWGDPELVLLVTGRQHGYIEPCGCTGLTNQKGGLARRHTLIRELAEKRGWNVVSLDVGNLVRRTGAQADVKFEKSVKGLKTMNYQAIAVGPDDVRLPGTLASEAANGDDYKTPFVSANVTVLDDESTNRHIIVVVGGKKIGVTAILGSDHLNKVDGDLITAKSPDEGLGEVWPILEAEECDLYVLLAHASLDESRKLAKRFPKFDVVVTAGGGIEPEYEAEKIPGTKSILVQVGGKGMYAGVVGVFNDETPALRFQRVPLDSRFQDSKEMLALLNDYQGQLKSLGLEGLEVTPKRHPSGRTFVGSYRCEDCHEHQYAIWRHGQDKMGDDGEHYVATQSLVQPGERVGIARHFDPECISCHVTGWNAQQFYPYESGYLDLKKSADFHGNGCENCHGPASEHVALAEELPRKDPKIKAAINRLTLDTARDKCLACHDLDNSPDFHVKGAFEEYWKKIEHNKPVRREAKR